MNDDIFFVWRVDKNITIDKFKEYLNSIEPRIQFTSKIERDRVLNVADLTVKRMDDRFIMKVYRKETHTNKYINWRSNVLWSVITGAMKTFIFRAYELCTLREDREAELDFLKDTFIANDCPVKVVDRVFGKYIPHKYKPNQAESELKPQNDYENVLNLPFVRGFSEKIKRELRKEGITVVFGKGKTLESSLCKLKQKIPKDQTKNNIYLKQCTSCNFKYIGESGQTLKQRDIGHKSDINTRKSRSGLYKHIRDNEGHEIDFQNQKILDREPNMFKRKIKEALYIKAYDNGTLMNPDKGTPVNDCWNEFTIDIRKSIKN